MLTPGYSPTARRMSSRAVLLSSFGVPVEPEVKSVQRAPLSSKAQGLKPFREASSLMESILFPLRQERSAVPSVSTASKCSPTSAKWLRSKEFGRNACTPAMKQPASDSSKRLWSSVHTAAVLTPASLRAADTEADLSLRSESVYSPSSERAMAASPFSPSVRRSLQLLYSSIRSSRR